MLNGKEIPGKGSQNRVIILRLAELHQMPDTPADQIPVFLKISVLSPVRANDLRNGLRHRGFLGNHKSVSHWFLPFK